MARPSDAHGSSGDLDRFADELERMSMAAEMAAIHGWLVEVIDPTLLIEQGESARTFYGPYADPIDAMGLAEHIDRKLAGERLRAGLNDLMSAPLVTKVVPVLPPPAI